jgi:DeoR family deoxyribose operon repressor
MKKPERIGQIIETLQATYSASIRELARKLAVSEMTIRRDLELLARDNIVRLVHAGAVLNPENLGGSQPKYSLTEAGTHMAEEKLRIGRQAASLIEPNDIVIIDSGSTTECLARSIPADLPVTVICFALNVLVEAHRNPACRLVFAGGALHENTLMFESPEGAQLVRRYRANKAFVSASGVNQRLGVTCANSYEVETKKAALASSLTRILLVDSSKFGRIQPAYFAELTDFELIITDSSLPPETAERIRELGIGLQVV